MASTNPQTAPVDSRCLVWQTGPTSRDVNKLAAVMEQGIAATPGWVCVRRNANYINSGHGETGFALSLQFGHRGKERAIARAMAENGAQNLFVELGYLRRANKLDDEAAYYQVGLGRTCWLPPCPCPRDRFEALGMPMETRTARRAGKGSKATPSGHVLILGQVPGDGQHGRSQQALAAWYSAAVATIREHTDRRIVFRPHPKARALGLCPDADEQQDSATPLAEAFRAAHCAVTFNSTAGTEAMLAGVPVVCDPLSMYAPWAETDLTAVEKPAVGDREDYFSRLAYAQWTRDEMRSGLAFAYLLQYLQGV